MNVRAQETEVEAAAVLPVETEPRTAGLIGRPDHPDERARACTCLSNPGGGSAVVKKK